MICNHCQAPSFLSSSDLRAHWRADCPIRSDWSRVSELRRAGEDGSADRLVRRLLGVKSEPMSEEKKEELRLWKLEHAEEIKARADLERQTKARLEALVAPAPGTGLVRRKA